PRLRREDVEIIPLVDPWYVPGDDETPRRQIVENQGGRKQRHAQSIERSFEREEHLLETRELRLRGQRASRAPEPVGPAHVRGGRLDELQIQQILWGADRVALDELRRADCEQRGGKKRC